MEGVVDKYFNKSGFKVEAQSIDALLSIESK